MKARERERRSGFSSRAGNWLEEDGCKDGGKREGGGRAGSGGTEEGGGACKRLISEAKHCERRRGSLPGGGRGEQERLDGRWRINEWVLARLSHDTVGGASGGGGNAGSLFPNLIPGGSDRAAELLPHQRSQVMQYKYCATLLE